MRLCVAILTILAAPASAIACPSFDFDDVASGGPIIDEARIDGGPFVITTKAVPPNPSLYFHRGENDGRIHLFTDESGAFIPVTVVTTGIPEYPLRFDLAIESGTISDSGNPRRRYEVQRSMTPATHWRTIAPWNGYEVFEIETDAALLRIENDGEVWTTSSSPHVTRYFRTPGARVTAIYADRREEVVYETLPPPATPAPDRRPYLVAIALLAVIVSVRRRCSPGSLDAFP